MSTQDSPTSTDWRAELQRLVQAYDDHGGKWPDEDVEALYNAFTRARAALAQAEPEVAGPSDEELEALAQELDDVPVQAVFAFARAVLARWGHHTSQED